MDIKTVLFIVIAFIGVIFFAISYLKLLNKILEQNKEDSNWDANKAREESEIGLKRETEKEINRLYYRIKLSSEVGGCEICDIYISELAIEYFKSKNFTVMTPNYPVYYYKISWEEKK